MKVMLGLKVSGGEQHKIKKQKTATKGRIISWEKFFPDVGEIEQAALLHMDSDPFGGTVLHGVP